MTRHQSTAESTVEVVTEGPSAAEEEEPSEVVTEGTEVAAPADEAADEVPLEVATEAAEEKVEGAAPEDEAAGEGTVEVKTHVGKAGEETNTNPHSVTTPGRSSKVRREVSPSSSPLRGPEARNPVLNYPRRLEAIERGVVAPPKKGGLCLEPGALSDKSGRPGATGIRPVESDQGEGPRVRIHPSSFNRLSGVGSQGQQFQQRAPAFRVLSNIGHFLPGDPEAFPGQCGDAIPPSGPWSARKSLPSVQCAGVRSPAEVELERLLREISEWANPPDLFTPVRWVMSRFRKKKVKS